jgi:hypothetical protein
LAEEALVLPAQNPRLFALVFLLIFAHTFLFVSVAVLRVHPLAAAIMDALTSTDVVWRHGKELALLYLASKLATQAAAVLAASATLSGDLVLRCKQTEESRILRARTSFFVITSALTAAALELVAAAALLLALTSSSSLLLGMGCVLLLLCLGALLPVTIAASTADESCGVRGAWRLVAARREDAAVLALAAGLLPVAVYPVYALALEFSRSNAAINPAYGFDVDRARGEAVLALGVPTYAYLLPSVGVQLFSAVAATVFHHRCRDERRHALTRYVPLVAVTVKQ